MSSMRLALLFSLLLALGSPAVAQQGDDAATARFNRLVLLKQTLPGVEAEVDKLHLAHDKMVNAQNFPNVAHPPGWSFAERGDHDWADSIARVRAIKAKLYPDDVSPEQWNRPAMPLDPSSPPVVREVRRLHSWRARVDQNVAALVEQIKAEIASLQQ